MVRTPTNAPMWPSLLLLLALAPKIFIRVLPFSFLYKSQYSKLRLDLDARTLHFVTSLREFQLPYIVKSS